MTSTPSKIAAWSFVIALVLWAATALAHEIGLSRGTYKATGEGVVANIVLSRKEAASVVSEIDPDRDGHVTQAELDAAKTAIQTGIVQRIRVSSGDAACPGALTSARLLEEDGVELEATYTCKGPVLRATVEVALFDELAYGHRHIARTQSGSHVTENVISKSRRTFEIEGSSEAAPPPKKQSYVAMLGLGIEHILTGYDHLLFLFGLVLVGGRWRSLLWVVTAFTLAHSITLGLAALNVWAPPSSIIEPMIALSIAYVGVENFFVKNAEKRWRVTFPFGLVHGFGFAGALREIALPKDDVPAALFLFNSGVEIGQVGVLAVVLPLLYLLRKRPWFEKYGVRALSGVIVIFGLVWFVTRIAS